MTADGLNDTYTYDALQRLTSIAGPNPATYIYDAFGNRVEENPSAGSTGYPTDFTFDLDGRVLHRTTSNNSAFGMEVYAQGRHLGSYVNGNYYETYQDQVGSLRMRVAYNSGGSTSYGTCSNSLPFGDAFNCSPPAEAGVDQDFFAGFRIDWDNGYVAPARVYSATQGRWYTPDPAGLAAVDITNPQSWNRYAYVENNPVSFTDPTGLKRPIWQTPGGGGWIGLYMATGGSSYNTWATNFIATQLASGVVVVCPQCDPGTPGGVAMAGMDNLIYGVATDFFRNDCSGPVSGGVAGAMGNCTTTFVGTGIVPIGTLTDIWYPTGVIPGIPNPSQGYYPEQHTATPTATVSAVNPPATTQPSFGEIASWCQIGTFLSGGGSAWGTPANPSPTYVTIYDQYGRVTGSVPLDPVSGSQGGAAAGGAAIIGAWGSCIGGASGH